MNIDTRKSLRWTLTIFPRTQPTRVLDTRVSTGTFVEVLNGVMLLAADMENNAVRMVPEASPSGEGFEVFCNVFVQFREVDPTPLATADGDAAAPGPGQYDMSVTSFGGDPGSIVDAAEWARHFYGEGGNRDMLASELAVARVGVGKPYAPQQDIDAALAAFDAEYDADAAAQRSEEV